ncbi:MAG: protein YgfX [Rickettsiella sp.]|nr:protein YgfX [Rickettsiella sp.]
MTVKFFRLKPSNYLAVLLLVIHGGAIACLWVLPWPWWSKLLLALACLMSFIALFRQHVLLNNPRSVIEFWQQNGSHWQLRDNLAEIKPAKLADNSICTRYFVLLNFSYLNKQQPQHISVLVLSDSLHEQDFRRLRCQLRSIN